MLCKSKWSLSLNIVRRTSSFVTVGVLSLTHSQRWTGPVDIFLRTLLGARSTGMDPCSLSQHSFQVLWILLTDKEWYVCHCSLTIKKQPTRSGYVPPIYKSKRTGASWRPVRFLCTVLLSKKWTYISKSFCLGPKQTPQILFNSFFVSSTLLVWLANGFTKCHMHLFNKQWHLLIGRTNKQTWYLTAALKN